MAPYYGPEPFLYLRRQAGVHRPGDPLPLGLGQGVGGAPAWVDRAPDGTPADLFADIPNSLYYVKGYGVLADLAAYVAASQMAWVADGGGDGTLVLWLTTPATGGTPQNYWNLSDGTLNNRVTLGRGSARVGNFACINATVAVANIGGGSQPDSTAVRAACGWALNDFLSVSDGTIATKTSGGAVPVGLTTLTRFTGYAALWNKEVGWFQKFANDDIRQMAEPDNGLMAYGDSNTANLIAALGTASSRYVAPGGVPSETSAQILARWLAAPKRWDKAAIFGMGRNDIGNGLSVAAALNNVASAVAKCAAGKFIVRTALPDSTDDATKKTALAEFNAALVTAYGSKVHDDLAALVAQATSPGDDASVAAGNIPTSLYASGPHPNSTGYNVLATSLWAKVQSLGY